MPRAPQLLSLFAGFLTLLSTTAPDAATPDETKALLFDPEGAIAYSQQAIGRRLDDHAFVDHDGRPVRLSDYDARPLVVSLIYTACAESCPILIEYLAEAVDVARETLGDDAFSVVTVGFDAEHDRPARLKSFARMHGIDLDDWRFLSGDAATVDALVGELAFLRLPSPRGFDHIAQVSIIDGERRVFRHAYGAELEPPALVEPLKALAFGELAASNRVEAMIERIRLFCTFYDPASGRYAFDYSFVISLTIGGLALLGVATVLVRAWYRHGHPPEGPA